MDGAFKLDSCSLERQTIDRARAVTEDEFELELEKKDVICPEGTDILVMLHICMNII